MRRRITSTLGTILLLIGANLSFGDLAVLVDEAVMVNKTLDEVATSATYLSTGGYAVTSKSYIDAVGLSFNLNGVASVSKATLRLPIQAHYSLGGSALVDIYGFADNGVIELRDYSRGFGTAIARIEASGLNEIVVDVTGITNAMLKSGSNAGFRIVSGLTPDDIPDGAFPAFKGVKFHPARYSLEFTPGPSPVPSRQSATYDGFKLSTPNIKVPGFGTVYTELQLIDVNNGIYELAQASVDPISSGPARSGIDLLDCDAFDPPTGISSLGNTGASYSINSGLLDIPQTLFNGVPYSAVLEFVEGTEPMRFRLISFKPYDALDNIGTISDLGGGLTIEPTQDFIPLCHGWVLIGDSSKNRLVERNIISGDTGGSYRFNTQPDQLTLDDVNNMVYFTTHPQTERLYKLNLNNGVISYNRIVEGFRQFAPRDLIMGEDGNIFAILFDRDQMDPPNPEDPNAPHGLWLGYLDGNAEPVFPNIPLEEPIRIEYDQNFQRVYLTTQSNLATFNFNPGSNEFTFVSGTDVEVGSGCTDFAVSPNGRRLAYTCPNGNNEDVTPLAIHDLDPLDYYNPDGEWYLGSTPVSATFNAGGDLFIATDGNKLYFFDVVTHLLLETYELGIVTDEVVKKIRLSRDGNILIVFIENELSDANGRMYWMPMPNLSGTPDF